MTSSTGAEDVVSRAGGPPPLTEALAIAREAIAHARRVVPHAGNQVVDMEADPEAGLRAHQANSLRRAFVNHVADNLEWPLHPSMTLHPAVRSEIAKCTRGGLCGEYASLAYRHIQQHAPHSKPRLVKSKTHGSHAWVEIESSDGKRLVVDPWPSKNRDVVEPSQHFAEEDPVGTAAAQDNISLQEKEIGVERLLEAWREFARQQAEQALTTATAQWSQQEHRPGTLDVPTTRRSADE